MVDDLLIDDDEARRHVENLSALYGVALAQSERLAREERRRGIVTTNLGVKRRALDAVIQAYDQKLVEIGDERFRMTGHAVMARWSREQIEQH